MTNSYAPQIKQNVMNKQTAKVQQHSRNVYNKR